MCVCVCVCVCVCETYSVCVCVYCINSVLYIEMFFSTVSIVSCHLQTDTRKSDSKTMLLIPLISFLSVRSSHFPRLCLSPSLISSPLSLSICLPSPPFISHLLTHTPLLPVLSHLPSRALSLSSKLRWLY